MRKIQMLSIALVALTILTAFYFYPMMPEKVASHWGMSGNPNGYMDRGVGTFLMPAIAVFVLALFYVMPLVDPKRESYKAFQAEYDGMAAIVLGFLYYVYLLTAAYNLGYAFNLAQFLAPGFGALFIYVGVVLSKAKSNWFVGIRTPWTLSSETVWNKTHALGSKLFMASGVVALLGLFLPIMFVASIAVVLAAAVATFAYSYVLYVRETKGKGNKKKSK